MIDNDDVDTAWLVWMLSDGWWALLFGVVFFIFLAVKCSNEDECAKLHCDTGKPTLSHHKCVCETEAK